MGFHHEHPKEEDFTAEDAEVCAQDAVSPCRAQRNKFIVEGISGR
jgi:hypothetical protein